MVGADVAGVRLGMVRVSIAGVKSLVEEIDSALELAEQAAHDAIRGGNYQVADSISELISRNLLEARTYTEANMPSMPQVTSGIASAAATASDLADSDPEFAPLLSALRRLRESANQATRGFRY